MHILKPASNNKYFYIKTQMKLFNIYNNKNLIKYMIYKLRKISRY